MIEKLNRILFKLQSSFKNLMPSVLKIKEMLLQNQSKSTSPLLSIHQYKQAETTSQPLWCYYNKINNVLITWAHILHLTVDNLSRILWCRPFKVHKCPHLSAAKPLLLIKSWILLVKAKEDIKDTTMKTYNPRRLLPVWQWRTLKWWRE